MNLRGGLHRSQQVRARPDGRFQRAGQPGMTTPACNGFLRLLARNQSFTPIGQTMASDATSPQGDRQVPLKREHLFDTVEERSRRGRGSRTTTARYQTQPTVGESCRCQGPCAEGAKPRSAKAFCPRCTNLDSRDLTIGASVSTCEADSTGSLTHPARVQHAVFEVFHRSVTWATFFASSCTVNYRYQCRSRATRHDDMDEQRYRSPHRRGVVGSPVTARSGHDGSGNLRTPRVPGDGRR
jgi:hypothetical protein